MSKDASKCLINLGNLSKPVDTLIKEISSAVRGFFAPFQRKRMAKAEAEKERTKAQSEIEITDLYRRAERRRIEEEAQHQKNMEAITARALPQLSENADPSSIEKDWFVNFLDRCRLVSDSEMQGLWARILAGEANNPGSYSKRSVNFLSDLEKTEAELFTKLCGFVWTIRDVKLPLVLPSVLNTQTQIYNDNGVNEDSLYHLDSIGLIQVREMTSALFFREDRYRHEEFSMNYYGRTLPLNVPVGHTTFNAGRTRFTRIGQELFPICGSKPVEGFWEYVIEYWTGREEK